MLCKYLGSVTKLPSCEKENVKKVMCETAKLTCFYKSKNKPNLMASIKCDLTKNKFLLLKLVMPSDCVGFVHTLFVTRIPQNSNFESLK